jgi:hypothetical protein
MPPAAADSLPTLYTARATALLYAAALAAMFIARRPAGVAARFLWTLGCVTLWVHVVLAMHFVHRWDHAHVLDHTAGQTAAMIGVRTGVGVYLNYVMMLFWAADVAYWWAVGSERYVRRSRPLTIALHAFMLFMTFNATVVFARGSTRYGGIAAIAACLAVLALRRRPTRNSE